MGMGNVKVATEDNAIPLGRFSFVFALLQINII